MTVRSKPSAAIACAVAVTLAVSGCGSSHAADRRSIVAVVNQFATAHDRRACDLLTDKAVAEVYGSGDVARGRARCAAASRRFHGGPVSIIQVKFSTTGLGPTVIARNQQTGRHYTVLMAKAGKRWLVDHITSP